MAAINLKAAGAIKQGEIIGRLDFGNSVDDLSIIKKNNDYCAFYKQDANGWKRLSKETLISSGWLNDTNAGIKALAEAILPYCQPAIVGDTFSYESTAVEIGLYFDGASKITSVPVTAQTTTDLIKQALGGTGSTSGTGATGTEAVTVPLWKKPILYIGIAVVAIIGYFAWKK